MEGLGYLGHCSGEDTWPNGFLSDIGACPSSAPTVIVEATQIPPLFWWVAAGVGLLLLLKKR